jgi:hypothetical protein
MSIYNINYLQKAIEMLPPDKRGTKFVKWVYALIKPVEYDNTKLFTDYKVGDNYPNYAAGSYSKFQRVIYGQSVYESLSDSNTALPTNTDFWRVYQNNFIGVDERVKYNHVKLTLEWAINKRFGTTFRQPPLISDIYFVTNVVPNPPFLVGGIEENSSIVYANGSEQFIINAYSFTGYYNFSIYVPVAVWTALSTVTSARDTIIRNFVDLYNTAGITYNIITY